MRHALPTVIALLVGAVAVNGTACSVVIGDYEIGDGGAGSDSASADDGGGGDDSGGGDDAGNADTSAHNDGASCSGSMQSGTVLCTQVLAAICARRVSCCAGANPALCGTMDTRNNCNCLGVGGGTCQAATSQSCSGTYCGATCAQPDCVAWMAHDPNGYDCSQAKFANKNLCSDTTTSCTNALPPVACSDFTGGTWNWPALCNTFWALF